MFASSSRTSGCRRRRRLTVPVLAASSTLLTAFLATSGAGRADELAELRQTFESAVTALNSGDIDGFLDTVHDEALSFYACGPTSGKQGREACALDWNRFFSSASGAEFVTSNQQYRVIGNTGIAWGKYALSVLYDGRERMTLHEGRYTMTYIRDGGRWRVIMQHNTPVGDDPQPVRSLRPPEPRP